MNLSGAHSSHCFPTKFGLQSHTPVSLQDIRVEPILSQSHSKSMQIFFDN